MTPATRNILVACLIISLVALSDGVGAVEFQSEDVNALSPLTVNGRRLENAAGKDVTLRGCNLGSWLLIEPWMLAIHDERIRDHYEFVTALRQRFGAARAAELLDAFRANWISEREFELVKSFGFNVVRVPFHHELLASDERPYELRADAFRWLDRAVDLGEKYGVYVTLDMHGAPGGQSIDMPSGHIGQNELWTSAECQKRAAWLWQRIAERYRDRAAVAAYDVLNEPWGDFQTNIHTELIKLVDLVHDAIREVDADTLIFAPGSTRGVTFYGDPREHGWTKTGFTEHFYPGLHGFGAPTLETHARFLNAVLPGKQRLIEQLDIPYLVGEFNVVHEAAARPELMRRYYDTFAVNGWSATMWTLRTISRDGGIGAGSWGLVTNSRPFELPDLNTADYDEILAAFEQLGETPLAIDEELRRELTSPSPSTLVLSEQTLRSPPDDASREPITGWISADVGARLGGAAVANSPGNVTIWGGGSDIWASHDEFHYLHRPATGDFEERAWLTSLEAPSDYSKAGWMLRADESPDAAHVLIHAFPDGRVMLGWRPAAGQQMRERVLGVSGIPVGLGLAREGDKLFALFTDCDGVWRKLPTPDVNSLASGGLIGMAVGSHEELSLASACFVNVDSADKRLAPRSRRGENLLANASFEEPADRQADGDRASHWDRWGQWFNQQEDWSPRREGRCVLAYHHWRIESPEDSGVYQDVSGLRPGARCTFSVYANRDEPAAGKHGADTVELRIENLHEGRLLDVSSQSYNVRDIATGDDWSLLQVTGTIPSDTARVLIRVTPSSANARDAAVKFDNAGFRVRSGDE